MLCLKLGDESAQLGLARNLNNPVMLHLAGTVLNNTQLEQVYLYLFKHYTLIVKTTTVYFILSNCQVVTRKLKV